MAFLTWGRARAFPLPIVAGLVITSAIAISLAHRPGATPTATADTAEQYASSATASSSYGANPGDDWNASQATGAPDTPSCGDKKTAWAPLTNSSDPEWLEVSFATPVHATGLTVYETFIGGFVYQVDLIDTGNVYHTIWTGTDTTPCPGEFTRTFSQARHQAAAPARDRL